MPSVISIPHWNNLPRCLPRPGPAHDGIWLGCKVALLCPLEIATPWGKKLGSSTCRYNRLKGLMPQTRDLVNFMKIF